MIKQSEVLPPHDIAAEEALLGAIIIDDAVASEVSINPDDYYHEPHRLIYGAMVNLTKSHTVINEITLSDELNRMGKLEYCGGVSYLIHLKTVCPSPLDAPSYADVVKRTSVARSLISIGEKITEMGYKNPSDYSKALSDCDEMLLGVRKNGLSSPLLTPKQRGEMLFERYHELATSEMIMALRTHIYDLDKLIGGGFYNGDVIIVGARTGVGKTTFLSYISDQISRSGNILFCSAEMGADSISDREVAQIARVPINRIRLGAYDETLEMKINNAVGEIANKKIYIYDEVPMTTDKILQTALSMQIRHGLRAVVIDYLGMLGDDYGRSPYERNTYISRRIKEVARKLNVPVIVAHQLSRDIEKRDDKRPRLSDLRDSGAIEQDADLVLFLYRDSYYDEEKEAEGITEIIIAKQRQGDSNRIVKVRYNKLLQRYQNLAVEEERIL